VRDGDPARHEDGIGPAPAGRSRPKRISRSYTSRATTRSAALACVFGRKGASALRYVHRAACRRRRGTARARPSPSAVVAPLRRERAADRLDAHRGKILGPPVQPGRRLHAGEPARAALASASRSAAAPASLPFGDAELAAAVAEDRHGPVAVVVDDGPEEPLGRRPLRRVVQRELAARASSSTTPRGRDSRPPRRRRPRAPRPRRPRRATGRTPTRPRAGLRSRRGARTRPPLPSGGGARPAPGRGGAGGRRPRRRRGGRRPRRSARGRSARRPSGSSRPASIRARSGRFPLRRPCGGSRPSAGRSTRPRRQRAASDPRSRGTRRGNRTGGRSGARRPRRGSRRAGRIAGSAGCRPHFAGRRGEVGAGRPSRRRAPSRSSKSQARRQKYDLVASSRRIGSDATRVTPSSSVK
jgi:hypothetical protein